MLNINYLDKKNFLLECLWISDLKVWFRKEKNFPIPSGSSKRDTQSIQQGHSVTRYRYCNHLNQIKSEWHDTPAKLMPRYKQVWLNPKKDLFHQNYTYLRIMNTLIHSKIISWVPTTNYTLMQSISYNEVDLGIPQEKYNNCTIPSKFYSWYQFIPS